MSHLLLVVLILETLNMTHGQLVKLLHSGVPLSMYNDKLVIIVWLIVSSYMLHFCWHSLVSSDIPLSMYMDISQNEVSVFGSKMAQRYIILVFNHNCWA